MKIWQGYGSEHSSNLVMIGRFKGVDDADKAREAIERLTTQVKVEQDEKRLDVGGRTERYSDQVRKLLRELDLWTLAPIELEQFLYDVSVTAENDRVVVKTDEADVSAFLKILLDRGARVEVFSAHHYPEDESKKTR